MIEQEGLRPERWQEGAYGGVGGVRGPFFCLATAPYRDNYIDMIGRRYADQETVQLEVATSAVATSEVCLDCTTTELRFAATRLGTKDPESLLRAGVPIMCYSHIPAAAIKVVNRFRPISGV